MKLLLRYFKNLYKIHKLSTGITYTSCALFKIVIMIFLIIVQLEQWQLYSKEDIPNSKNLLIRKIESEDFVKEKNKIIEDLSFTEDQNQKYQIYIGFLEFLFHNKCYHEVVDLYEFIERHFEQLDIESEIKYQFFFAVSLLLQDKSFQAKEEFKKILTNKRNLSEEILMWHNYSLSFDSPTLSSEFKYFLNLQGVIKKKYPKEIYLLLQDKFLQILFVHKEFHKILSMDIIEDGLSLFTKYLAQYELEKNLDLLLSNLQHLTNSNDIETSIKSKLKLIEIELHNDKISLNEAIKRLKNLNYTSLGHNIRFNILKNLSDYYKSNEELEKSLRIYKYLEYHFEDLSYEVLSQKEHIENFIKIFTETKTSDWNKLSFFFQFENMIPTGSVGNEIISKIIQAFINLNLLDHAIELLEHQVKFKLTGTLKFQSTVELAKLYIKTGKINDSLVLLNNADLSPNEFQNYQIILALKAKIYFLLNQHDRVLNILDELEKKESLKFKSDMLFVNKEYRKLVELYNNNKNDWSENVKDKFQRAISYFVLNKIDELKILYDEIDEKHTTAKSYIELFITYLSVNNIQDINIFNQINLLLEQISRKL